MKDVLLTYCGLEGNDHIQSWSLLQLQTCLLGSFLCLTFLVADWHQSVDCFFYWLSLICRMDKSISEEYVSCSPTVSTKTDFFVFLSAATPLLEGEGYSIFTKTNGSWAEWFSHSASLLAQRLRSCQLPHHRCHGCGQGSAGDCPGALSMLCGARLRRPAHSLCLGRTVES